MRLIRRLSVVLFVLCSALVTVWDVVRSTDRSLYLGFYRLVWQSDVYPIADLQAKICIFLFVLSTAAVIILCLLYRRDDRAVLSVKGAALLIPLSAEMIIMFSTAYSCFFGGDTLLGKLIYKISEKDIAGFMLNYKIAVCVIAAAAFLVLMRFLVCRVKRNETAVSVICVALSAAMALSACAMVRNLHSLYDLQRQINGVIELLNSQKTVIHAFGWYDDHIYTNSYEALVNCYEDGNRVCETDFNLTSDGYLILGHENGNESWVTGIDSAEPLTREEFLSRRYLDLYTTMSLDDLAAFMREHEDFYVVTDIKGQNLTNIEGCALIASACPDLMDRFIIQIYHISEYGQVRELGFRNIIFTLYATSEEERSPAVLTQNLNDCDLVALSFWTTWSHEDFIEPVSQTGVLMFVHTEDEVDLMRSYIDRGFLIYTDNTDNSWLRYQQ